MFKNVGAKIKIISKIIAWIGIVFCGIYGFVMLVSVEDMAFAGFMIMTVGSLCSYVFSLVLHGFGEIVEKAESK